MCDLTNTTIISDLEVYFTCLILF